MVSLNTYLKNKTEINKNKLLNKYKEFNYEDDEEMFIDLEFLLSTKYKNIKLVEVRQNRDGQTKFREKIIDRDKECVITNSGCEMCEAAHIIPHCESEVYDKYNIDNGILLNAAIHKLFDKYLWSINPKTSQVEISNKILNNSKYNINNYINKKIKLNKNQLENLKHHYKLFCKKNEI